MRTYKHKTQSTRNAQLTYYSVIKNQLKSILFRDERKQWRERKSALFSGRLFHTFTTWHAKKCFLTSMQLWFTYNLYGWPRVEECVWTVEREEIAKF